MKTITIAKGDGIGPEIMEATLSILKAAKAPLTFEEVEIGEQVYLNGNTSGITSEAWQSIRKNKIFLKGPITTPQGGGYKSLNVTTRKALNLFANVRPCRSYHPYLETKHPKLDVVIIRENEEDLYAGIEHQQTDEVVQCLKLISRPGCEKIVRYAFEYAKSQGRKKVSCFTKDNIMKQTDGLFHSVFREIAKEYTDIENEHMIIDIGAAKLADSPELFDVIVVPNLYGDIISDIVAQITGSVGLSGSANIGMDISMFEAIHGSAPDIAGKNMANPSGLLQAAVMMLNHIGENQIAATIANAWLKTIEDGCHTADIYKASISKRLLTTADFAEIVISNLGQKPQHLQAMTPISFGAINMPKYERKEAAKKELKGVDIFIDWKGEKAEELANKLKALETEQMKLSMITNRGIKVWPNGFDETFCTDHWRCRFDAVNNGNFSKENIVYLLDHAVKLDIDTIKTENLYAFDGRPCYSLGQGQ